MGLLVLIVTTVAEGLGLVFWMHDAHHGHFARGMIWLVLGEAIEVGVFIAYLYRGPTTKRDRSSARVLALIIGVAIFETALWVAWWYSTAFFGLIAGAFVLTLLMHVKHDADVAFISDTRLLLNVLTPKGLTATGLEVIAALTCMELVRRGAFWPGAAVLLGCITVEHFVGGLIVLERLTGRHFLTSNPARLHARDRQSAVLCITQIDPDQRDQLTNHLREVGDDVMNSAQFDFRQFETLHFCSWSIAEESGDEKWLIFEANVDGAADEFINRLVHNSRTALDAIYVHCIGYPVGGSPADIVQFLSRHQQRANTFYVGLPGMTVERIKREEQLRRHIEQVLDQPAMQSKQADEIRRQIQEHVRSEPSFAWTETTPAVPFLVAQGPLVLGVIAIPVAILALGIAIVLSPVLIPIVVVLLLRFRHLEKTDPVAEGETNDVPAAIMSREDRQVMNHLANVSPIKPGILRLMVLRTVLWLVNLLARLVFTRGVLGGTSTIHFARWVIINRSRDLLFLSNYDGSWENYLGDFVDRSSAGLTAIWSNTIEFPRARWLIFEGAAQEQPFKAAARRRQVPSLVWYSAYPTLTSQNILNNKAVREGLFEDLRGKELERWLRRL